MSDNKNEILYVGLHIADTNITSGTCAVSWCLNKSTIDRLTLREQQNPAIVIVIAPDGSNYHPSKEYRKVVSLNDLMTYVEFHCAGKNKIWAFIPCMSLKNAKDMFLSKTNGYFNTTILNSDGDDWHKYWSYEPLVKSEHISVEVPKECFASEPSAWEKKWVNHFFKGKSVDQCEFRRRRLFAYGLQPLLMLGNIILRVPFLIFALLWGNRKVSIMPILHPLTYDLIEAFSIADPDNGSIFWRRLPEDNNDPLTFSYIIRKVCLLPFMPILFLPVSLLVYYHHVLIASGIFGGIFLFLFFIALLISGALGAFGNYLTDCLQNIFEGKVEGNWLLDQSEVDMLICTGEKKFLKLSQLPSKKRTLKLRFLDLKSKVCKPFSR